MKKYKVERMSLPKAIAAHFPETLKATAGFVASSVISGCFYGPIYSLPVDVTNAIEVGETGTGFLVGIFCTAYFAKEVYKNFKAEKQRVYYLAAEMEKERAAKKAMREQEQERILDEAGFVTVDLNPNPFAQINEPEIGGKQKVLQFPGEYHQ